MKYLLQIPLRSSEQNHNTAMQYGDDIYGVKITVREKRNGSTVFYTLETHDLDIQKINPETESSRGGLVKAALPVRTPTIKFSMFFEKFKPINDLLELKYKEKGKAEKRWIFHCTVKLFFS